MNHEEKVALLMRLDERTAHLVAWTKTHADLHTRLTLAFMGAVVSALLALGTTMVSLIVMLTRSNGQ